MRGSKAARPATAATVDEPPGSDLGQINSVATRKPSARQLLRPGSTLVALPPNAFSPPAGNSTVRHLSGPPRGEESDSYPVIAALNHGWRVVACKGGVQWILQKRRGRSNNWRSRYFCRTREGLFHCVCEHAGQIDTITWARLLRLPQWIGGAR